MFQKIQCFKVKADIYQLMIRSALTVRYISYIKTSAIKQDLFSSFALLHNENHLLFHLVCFEIRLRVSFYEIIVFFYLTLWLNFHSFTEFIICINFQLLCFAEARF